MKGRGPPSRGENLLLLPSVADEAVSDAGVVREPGSLLSHESVDSHPAAWRTASPQDSPSSSLLWDLGLPGTTFFFFFFYLYAGSVIIS